MTKIAALLLTLSIFFSASRPRAEQATNAALGCSAQFNAATGSGTKQP